MSSFDKEIIDGNEYLVYRDIQNNIPYESYIRNIQFWDIPYFKMLICNEDGSPRYTKYFKNGYLYRKDGPAVIYYKEDGSKNEIYINENFNETIKDS